MLQMYQGYEGYGVEHQGGWWYKSCMLCKAVDWLRPYLPTTTGSSTTNSGQGEGTVLSTQVSTVFVKYTSAGNCWEVRHITLCCNVCFPAIVCINYAHLWFAGDGVFFLPPPRSHPLWQAK